ncbi:MAG: T9SS type A sorting domain-containing protein [Bacteroidetes bacterium]|nr:T9SS type A sorting domain-containing protein [Bacteroidota bacterium]
MKANRFEVPVNGTLNSVLIDQPYQSDLGIGGIPPGTPRDYELVVWDETPGGLPGNELYSRVVTDLSGSGIRTFIFQTIDLTADANQLTGLPPVIFIGVRNTGPDENYFHMTFSEFSGTGSPSYVFTNDLGGWAAFNGLCVVSCVDGVDLNNYVHPIRARFVIDSGPTAIDDDFELPVQISLEQNYPNPFNPVTSIRFSLPNATDVSLRVFDLLGREVDTLVDELLSSGPHEVQFDASSLASGIYIYKLESASESLTRTMTLLK